MLSTEPDFEEILAQVERLSPEDRVLLIQRIAETLVTRGISAAQRRLVYGEFRGPRMSTEEDFKIAEWRPTERDLHGP